MNNSISKMNNKLKWNDLQLILAISQTGSLSGAGKRLDMSHATVFRHLAVIEKRLDTTLFKRSRTGCVPTLSGEELADTAQQIDLQVLEAERRVIGRDLSPAGTIRVTTLDSLLVGLLNPVLLDFRKAYENISLEIVVSNQLFNLSRHETDFAIRPTRTPSESLYGCKLAKLEYAVYGKKELCAKDASQIDFHTLDWVGPDKAMHYPEMEIWLTQQGLNARCTYRVDSVLGMYAAVSKGFGLAVLPRYLGDSDSCLSCLSESIAEIETEIWALTRPSMRQSVRIRALLEFLAESVPLQLDKVIKC